MDRIARLEMAVAAVIVVLAAGVLGSLVGYNAGSRHAVDRARETRTEAEDEWRQTVCSTIENSGFDSDDPEVLRLVRVICP